MAEGVQLIMDTLPKQGGGGGGQTREEVVDALCEELLGKVGSSRCGGPGDGHKDGDLQVRTRCDARASDEGGC